MTMTPTLPPGETKAERVRASTSMLDPADHASGCR